MPDTRRWRGTLGARGALIAALTLSMAGPALAINKCTGPGGQVVYSDAPCPSTTRDTQMEWRPSSATNRMTPAAGVARRVDPSRTLQGVPQAASLVQLYQLWADTERVALVTPRIALAPQITRLQDVRRQVAAVGVPACLDEAKDILLKLATASVDALVDFLGRETLTAAVYQHLDRARYITLFEEQVQTAQRCDR
jgi:hypothetical protein